jgi:predicted RNA binding protein YcfA (HicA-like mRNA interferase family)
VQGPTSCAKLNHRGAGYRASLGSSQIKVYTRVKFAELVRLLEEHGFRIVKEKGSVRYYGREGYDKLIRVDYHGSKQVPTGTCQSILKTAGIKR